MIIDLSVKITEDRPWFGYRKPDDFAVGGSTGQFGVPSLVPKDVPMEMNLSNFDHPREGYPWLSLSHTRHYIMTLTNIGFRWQTLLAIPETKPWMKLDTVPDDTKYDW